MIIFIIELITAFVILYRCVFCIMYDVNRGITLWDALYVICTFIAVTTCLCVAVAVCFEK